MTRGESVLAGAVLVCALSGCGESKATLPQPGQVIGLTVTGSGTLSAVGDRTQFVATARMPDGTEQDVSQQVTWTSADQSIARVEPGGLVTATGLGVTDIRASFGQLVAMRTVIVSPVPTYSSSGWVRSPGSSALGGVKVSEAVSGRSTVTTSNGVYSLIALVGPTLRFERDGYEAVDIIAVPNDIANDAAMQQLIRVDAGDVINDRLARNDVSYEIGSQFCQPCRRIRIVAPGPGRMRMVVTWTSPRAGIRVHAADRVFAAPASDALELTAEFDVNGGEQVIYVGANRPPDRDYFEYRVTTSFSAR